MKQKVTVKDFYALLLILISCAFLAIGVNMVYEPLEMVIGGITGLGITLRSLILNITGYDIPVSTFNLILNIPILLFAIKMKGIKFFVLSLYGTVMLSIMLMIIPVVSIMEEDMLLAALVGGGLTGVGTGILFRAGLSTGGTDLIATLISMKTKRISQSVSLGLVDGAIVLFGLSVFGLYKSMYALMALFVMTKVSDGIIAGFAYTKLIMIVTDRGEEISEEILKNVKRGITLWNAKGAYSRSDKEVLMCACGRKETRSVIKIANEYDNKSFVIVLSAKEIMGEGFKQNI